MAFPSEKLDTTARIRMCALLLTVAIGIVILLSAVVFTQTRGEGYVENPLPLPDGFALV